MSIPQIKSHRFPDLTFEKKNREALFETLNAMNNRFRKSFFLSKLLMSKNVAL